MDSIITRFLERVLLLKTEAYLIITSQIVVILLLALPQMALLYSKSGSILHGSSSFSITISLYVKATALMCDLHELVVGEHLSRTEVSPLSVKRT